MYRLDAATAVMNWASFAFMDATTEPRDICVQCFFIQANKVLLSIVLSVTFPCQLLLQFVVIFIIQNFLFLMIVTVNTVKEN